MLALGWAATVMPACGTDAVGIETCRSVEDARCKQAPHCGIDLTKPPHRNSPTNDVEACIRYYDTACLHGLEVPTDPGATAANACIAAINTGDCMTVLHPETNAACTWLNPPPPAPDAGEDGAAAEAGMDGTLSYGGDASIE